MSSTNASSSNADRILERAEIPFGFQESLIEKGEFQGRTYTVFTKTVTHDDFLWKLGRGVLAFLGTALSLTLALFFTEKVPALWKQALTGNEIFKIKVFSIITDISSPLSEKIIALNPLKASESSSPEGIISSSGPREPITSHKSEAPIVNTEVFPGPSQRVSTFKAQPTDREREWENFNFLPQAYLSSVKDRINVQGLSEEQIKERMKAANSMEQEVILQELLRAGGRDMETEEQRNFVGLAAELFIQAEKKIQKDFSMNLLSSRDSFPTILKNFSNAIVAKASIHQMMELSEKGSSGLSPNQLQEEQSLSTFLYPYIK